MKVGESLTLPERVAEAIPGTKFATKQNQCKKSMILFLPTNNNKNKQMNN